MRLTLSTVEWERMIIVGDEKQQEIRNFNALIDNSLEHLEDYSSIFHLVGYKWVSNTAVLLSPSHYELHRFHR